MKILIKIILFIFISNSSLVLQAQEMGDVDNNQSVNILDALVVSQYYVGLTPAVFYANAADVDGNGSINIVDALLIAQYYVGLIIEFPAETPVPTPVVTLEPTPTLTPPNVPTPGSNAWTGAFIVQYRCLDANTSTTTLKPSFQIFNIGESDTLLSEFKIRYWYTKEGIEEETYSIGYAVMGIENVTVNFGESSGYHYSEVGFTMGAGFIGSGNISGAVNVTIKMTDNTVFNQSDDYSWDPSHSAFAGCFPVRDPDIGWNKATLYWQDVHIWGIEPSGKSPAPYPGPTAIPDSQFIFLINVYHDDQLSMDEGLVNHIYPYLRNGDIITIVQGNGNDMSATGEIDKLNQRTSYLQSMMSDKNLLWTCLCAGITNMEIIAQNISPSKISCIFYDYESNKASEPEFTTSFADSIFNIQTAQTSARNYGFLSGTAPTARGLFDYGYKEENWNYGEIAIEVDMMIAQLQSRLKDDYNRQDMGLTAYRFYAVKLMHQLVGAGTTASVFPQVTVLSQENPNGAPVEYCIEGIRVLMEQGFPGTSIWFSPSSVSLVVDVLKQFRSVSP